MFWFTNMHVRLLFRSRKGRGSVGDTDRVGETMFDLYQKMVVLMTFVPGFTLLETEAVKVSWVWMDD